jgi:hypothetical protein
MKTKKTIGKDTDGPIPAFSGIFMRQGSQKDMKMTPSLNPSPQGRETICPSPLGGEGWVRGIFETMISLLLTIHHSLFTIHYLLPLKVVKNG